MLETLNVQNNKLQNLKRVEQLPNLKEVDASNNLIISLHREMQDMFSIETLKLYGNPIVNSNAQLAQIENNQSELKSALETYFGGSGSTGIAGLQPIKNTFPTSSKPNFGSGTKAATSGYQAGSQMSSYGT